MAYKQGSISVLLSTQVAQQCKQVFRVILVHRRIGRRPNHDGRKRAVSHQHHCHSKGERVDCPPSFFLGPNEQKGNRRDQQSQINQGTGIECHSEVIDKEQFEAARQLNRTFDQSLLDKSEKCHRHNSGDHQPLPRKLIVPIVIHQRYGWDGQQIQEVNSDGKPHEVSDEDEPFGGSLLIGDVLPLQDRPKHQSREEAGQSVHLPLHSTEPEGITEGVGQCTDDSRAQDSDQGATFRVRRARQALGQMCDAPKKEQNGERTAEY